MKLTASSVKALIKVLGYKPENGSNDIYYKQYVNHNNYTIKVNFETEKIEFRNADIPEENGIKWGDTTTSNFENSENFVVFECVNRLLEKGYEPKSITLEKKYPLGRNLKGKLDIVVTDNEEKPFLMVECKTWGIEYEKELKKMIRDGGQLFSYYVKDKAAKYLCLYASQLTDQTIEYRNDIVPVDEAWLELTNDKEIHDHWNKNFKDNGIFEEWANAYDIEIKALVRGRLNPLTKDDSGRIFNQFAEILRHNVVSDKPNAFNKILNLFICKIIDEDRNEADQVEFQWVEENDTDESLQARLNDLYKKGMHRFLDIDVTDYSDDEISNKLTNISDKSIMEEIKAMFAKLRLQKNPEFAFVEVYNDQSFKANARVVREVVELLQPYQFRYGHKQQFLGDFFELLLNTSIKQESGQFFTPVPITRFIVSSLPIKEFILNKLKSDNPEVLPFVIDYATGSGHFLTEYMDQVQNIIESIDVSKAIPSARKKINVWRGDDAKFDWAKDYVYGIEADYRLVKTSKVSSFLNGDGEANIIRANGLDHFAKSKEYKGKLREVSKDDRKDNGQFDILISNPPYSVNAFKSTVKYGEDSFELFERLTDNSSEIECLFIERTKQLLKVGGWAGVILPNSILSNTGFYTAAREIILKYFNIKAITEFGSNTFMATGTNTVTFFLERRQNNDHKLIESAISSFFERPKDATVLGIEKAFGKYVSKVFEGILFDDYISFVNKEPTEEFKKQEIFDDYKNWFNGLTETRQLKDKKAFKEMKCEQQKAEIDKLFYSKIFEIEKDKMLYFLLIYPQKTVVIKVGEKQDEKDFIGYEFSYRRGHEGIKMLPNGTKLYDESNPLNPQKANSYICNTFLGNRINVDETMKENVSMLDTFKLINFNVVGFEKIININIKKKIDFKTKWDSEKLGILCNIKIGGTPSRNVNEYYINGTHNWLSISEMNGNVIYNTKEKINDLGIKESNVKLIKAGTTLVSFKLSIGKTAIAGTDLYTNEAIAALEIHDQYSQSLRNKYLFDVFSAKVIDLTAIDYKAFGKSLNSTFLKELSIPLPPIDVQEKIVSEIEAIEKIEKSALASVIQNKDNIRDIYFEEKGIYESKRLSGLIEIISGGTPSTAEMSYWNGGIPWLSIADFNTGKRFVDKSEKTISENGLKNSNATYIYPSEIVVSARGTVGALAQVKIPMTFNQSCYGIRGLNGADNNYLYYALKYEIDQLKNNSYGAVFDAITIKTFDSIYIPLPPIDKQEEIVSKIEAIEVAIQKLETEIADTENKKKHILTKYL